MSMSRRQALAASLSSLLVSPFFPMIARAQAAGVHPGDPDVMKLTAGLIDANLKNAGASGFKVSLGSDPMGGLLGAKPLVMPQGYAMMVGGTGMPGAETYDKVRKLGRDILDTLTKAHEILTDFAELFEKVVNVLEKLATTLEKIQGLVERFGDAIHRITAAVINTVAVFSDLFANVAATVAKGVAKGAKSVVKFFKKLFGGKKSSGIIATVDLDGDGRPDGTIFDIPMDAAYTMLSDFFVAVGVENPNLSPAQIAVAISADAKSFLTESRVQIEGVTRDQALLLTS
ncbi:hypothetical protein PXK00_16315 [Phaeobacter sp. QD34_3]|uniref:hypothetical protein n=1 Tax=unclassified Phaeobacter TaxID=2621772 RepID=UPI00237F6AB1|nr:MULTISPECIES: hypothetical protein [unclassified Phaeobacter]MDE4134682.1 hypothetical protein [Phaeobacter sp. QD34_3]MDE4138348.1 hypothetical protein [Phaeobacter sp. QD34_24]MDE4176098.1 hypothetical protein [Phaeobacter sp. PT47_59]